MENLTAPVSAAAIKLIKEARKAGRELFFNVSPEMAREVNLIASFYPGPKEVVMIYADGGCETDFWGEDDGVEAAIEKRNDAWAQADTSDDSYEAQAMANNWELRNDDPKDDARDL